MSRIININNIEEGMVTAEAVKNKFGVVMLPAGAILEERHKRILKGWNIQTLHIKSVDNGIDSDISDNFLQTAEQHLKMKMDWVPKDDFEKSMYDSAVHYIAKSLIMKEEKEKEEEKTDGGD